MTTLISPKFENPSPYKAIEPPIWCALLASEGDTIIDNEVEDIPDIDGDILIVVMGNNPSVSSTPKMPEALKLLERFPQAKLTGLHPIATGIANYQMPSILALSQKPRARWNLLDMSKYRAHNWHCLHDLDSRGNYASLYTSYGCPFDCDYCNIHTIYQGRRVFHRNLGYVLGEIDYLVRVHNVKNLKFCDELFVLNKSRISQLCDILVNYKLNIWAYARVDTVDAWLLEKMKKAGIHWLAYGFESANEKTLAGVNKKQTIDTMRRAVELTKEAGINVLGNFMFGLPDDDPESMQETLELAKEFMCEYVNFYCTMAYPGSRLYKGDGGGWELYNQLSLNFQPLDTKYISGQEVLRFRDNAFQEYFSDESYLAMIETRFGEQAVAHIEEMLKWHPRVSGDEW